MAEQVGGTVSYRKVATTEATWKPEGEKIEVVLYPREGEEDFYPPSAPSPLDTPFPQEKRACYVNIETTGTVPFESRVFAIAAADAATPETVMEFTGPDEQKIVALFFEWFELQGFEQLIGYNVSFDYRFMFSRAMKYGLIVPSFAAAGLKDIMQIMQQVKEAYVYGYNKPGGLDSWTEYFFGISGGMTNDEVQQAWLDKDFETIAEFNRKRILQVELLDLLQATAKGGADE